MMRGMLRICLGVLSLGLVACSSEVVATPTQVMVRIETSDAALLAQMTYLRMSVSLFEANGWKTPVQSAFPMEGLRWPVEIPVFPRKPSDAGKSFEVVVDALAGPTVLAQARAVTGFVAGQRVTLTLSLFGCTGAGGGYVVCALGRLPWARVPGVHGQWVLRARRNRRSQHAAILRTYERGRWR